MNPDRSEAIRRRLGFHVGMVVAAGLCLFVALQRIVNGPWPPVIDWRVWGPMLVASILLTIVELVINRDVKRKK